MRRDIGCYDAAMIEEYDFIGECSQLVKTID